MNDPTAPKRRNVKEQPRLPICVRRNFRRARLRALLSQREVAHHVGISLNSVKSAELEQEVKSMNFYTAARLCEVYGITLDSLFDEDEPPR